MENDDLMEKILNILVFSPALYELVIPPPLLYFLPDCIFLISIAH
jgi:hypothetical protein